MTVLRHPNNQGVTLTQWRKTASGGETSLSGTDDFGAGLAYTAGAEQVFVNGVLIERGVDYTASTGTTVTGLTALVAGDIVTVSSPSAFNVANAIPKATVAAKGDLIVGNGASSVTNLPVGADGTTLVANSSASTGVSWGGNIAAGKNFVINGGMDIWQRGTGSFTSGYTADRWSVVSANTAVQQSTTAPTGFTYSAQLTSSNSGATGLNLWSPLESKQITPLVGQTVTISVYVQTSISTTTNIAFWYSTSTDQGTGGSWNGIGATIGGSGSTNNSGFTRITGVFSVPSNAKSLMVGIAPQSMTNGSSAYITGVQLEVGSVATPFSRAGGTLQGELAACQRYLPAINWPGGISEIANGFCISTTQAFVQIPFQVPARVAPTGITLSSASHFQVRQANGSVQVPTGIAFNNSSTTMGAILTSGNSGLVGGNGTSMQINSSSGQILFTGCEL